MCSVIAAGGQPQLAQAGQQWGPSSAQQRSIATQPLQTQLQQTHINVAGQMKYSLNDARWAAKSLHHSQQPFIPAAFQGDNWKTGRWARVSAWLAVLGSSSLDAWW